jgi:hypothetical protein
MRKGDENVKFGLKNVRLAIFVGGRPATVYCDSLLRQDDFFD